VIRLHTFGGARLTHDSGRPLGGAATQRRTLALLSVLAVAGEAGLSRDKLIGLLWPESDEERARHSLTQALYAARRALQCDDLFASSSNTIRLESARLQCDVRDFESAIERGDLESAVAVYAGPFLDGFFLSSSQAFEQWSSAQRDRLQAALTQSLDTLATRAETAGDTARAVEWRRRLAAVQPLDSGNVVKLMTALAGAGDRAGAIQQARLHAALLHQEMELDPDPAVEALAERLRERASWSDEPAGETMRLDEPDATADVPALPVATTFGEAVVRPSVDARGLHHGAGDEAPDSSWPRSTVPRQITEVTIPIWLRWAILSIVMVALIGTGVLIGRARRDPPPSVDRLTVPQRVVVAPFRVTGADPSLAFLRDGMVELLSTRLADDSSARSLDAGAVLGAWRAAGLNPAMDVSRDTVVRLASRLGAERVVIGSVVGTPARVLVRAAVVMVPSGSVSAEASVSGPVDGLPSLIDRLAGQLLAAEAGEDEQLALHTTRSLPALRAFLAGQAALRAMDYTAALRQYELALRRDSTFALAALQAATLADRIFDTAASRRWLRLAWMHRDGLTPRDRLRLDLYAGPRYPAPATVAEQRVAWQRVVELSETDADLWFVLGTRIYHDGALAALPAARDRATEALQRAMASAPYPPARGLLVAMGALPLEGSERPGSLGPFAPFARWRDAAVRGDSVTLRQLRDTMFRLGSANLRAIALASQHDGLALDDGARASQWLSARAARAADRVDALLAEHAQAQLRGRAQDARGVLARLERVQPGSAAPRRLRVLDWLYGDGDSLTADAAARELEALTGADPASSLASSEAWAANVCVVGQWRLARGDSAGVQRAAEALVSRGAGARAPSAPVSAAPGSCAELLAAGDAVLVGTRDAPLRLQRLDSLVLAPHVVGDLAQYAPLLLARLHERAGDRARALAAIRRRSYMSDWPRYRAAMLREEGRLARQVGDSAGSRRATAQYLMYRDSVALAGDGGRAVTP
jgi:DNA-binding SARP family transcriptional activator/TolB-like protein